MNGKTRVIIGIAAFVVLLGLASFAYSSLGSDFDMPDRLPTGSGSVVGAGNGTDVATGNGPNDSPGSGSDAGADVEKTAAPDFTVADAAGGGVSLSDFLGKPVVLNFWASWCPPCKVEMPDFNTVYEEIGGEVAFMMVDLVDGRRETQKTGEKYVAEQGFTFPVYYDTTEEAAYVYGVSSIPTTVFIDRDGYIITGAVGAIDEKTLRLGIDMIK